MNGNTITVVGNLTKDPTIKYLSTGKAVAEFSIACNHGWWDREAQVWVDGDTSYFKVECWETMAENVVESLRRGDPVIVIGRLSRRTYVHEEVTKESWEIKADTIGADLRKRAASLRRVLRQSLPNGSAAHPAEPGAVDDGDRRANEEGDQSERSGDGDDRAMQDSRSDRDEADDEGLSRSATPNLVAVG